MISIVMSYYNRLPQLQFTLRTIDQSVTRDVEIIVVDDFSDQENSLVGIQNQFPGLDIKTINMRDVKPVKDYCNPCVPYNVGLRASRGDIVIIQNPECCHMGDVITHSKNHCVPGKYLSFHCWSCVKHETRLLQETGRLDLVPTKKSRWYNHRTERPVAFHFCNAIARPDLVAINGFDERYATGHNWDDAEILHRIRRICQVEFVEEPYVIHQYHHKSYGHPDNIQPNQNNKDLYFDVTEPGPTAAPNLESIR